MFLPFTVILVAAVFGGQLALCLRGVRGWLRGLIPALLATGICVCGAVMAAEQFIALPYGAAFSAYFYGLILLFLLAADGFAWLIYGAVKLVQKRRK